MLKLVCHNLHQIQTHKRISLGLLMRLSIRARLIHSQPSSPTSHVALRAHVLLLFTSALPDITHALISMSISHVAPPLGHRSVPIYEPPHFSASPSPPASDIYRQLPPYLHSATPAGVHKPASALRGSSVDPRPSVFPPPLDPVGHIPSPITLTHSHLSQVACQNLPRIQGANHYLIAHNPVTYHSHRQRGKPLHAFII
jgi:hypothetical protein